MADEQTTEATTETTESAGATEGESLINAAGGEKTETTESKTEEKASTEKEGETKAEGDGAKADSKEGEGTEKDEVKEGAPEKYEPFKFPDNFPTTGLQEKFETYAREMGLSQEAAQKFVDVSAKDATEQLEAQNKAADAQVKAWAEESRKDPEFGGEKFDENMTHVAYARDTFATPELRALLDSSGFGNHKEFLRFYYRVGKALAEDKHAGSGGDSTKGSQSRGQRMYPSKAA